MEVIDIFGRIA